VALLCGFAEVGDDPGDRTGQSSDNETFPEIPHPHSVPGSPDVFVTDRKQFDARAR
jgi:hypothetical protein